jgi:ketosteroid isomerase-like protein
MKRLLAPAMLIAIAIGIVSCTPNENTVQRNPGNEALVQKYFDAVLKGDITTMESLLADNYKEYGPAVKDSINRVTSLAEWTKTYEGFSSIEYDRYAILSSTVPEGRVKGDWVFDWGRVTANYKNGDQVTFDGHWVFKIENGKIVQQNNFYNVADILGQLKYTFTPPSDTTQTATQ